MLSSAKLEGSLLIDSSYFRSLWLMKKLEISDGWVLIPIQYIYTTP